MSFFKHLVAGALACAALVSTANAQVKIAVADLTYKDTIREAFSFEAGYAKSTTNASANYRASDYSASGQERYADSQEAAYVKSSGVLTRIEYGELRAFTGDIKGTLLSSGRFRVTQARPYNNPNGGEQIFDIIARIKKGYYPGADYVLFGTVDSVEWRNDVQPVQNTTSTMLLYSLELGAEFSLINTRTYEVKAAFSAVGEGNDNKIYSDGVMATPNKARVMQQVARSLAEEVGQQLSQQFAQGGAGREAAYGSPPNAPAQAGQTGSQATGVKVYE
jgi:hypothetical protein